MNQATRLWKLSDEIQQLENATAQRLLKADHAVPASLIAIIVDNEDLTDDDREAKLEETFNQWLEVGESFNPHSLAPQMKYIRSRSQSMMKWRNETRISDRG